jgi:tetratricopeptide (TPR) repeat protein
MRPNKEPQRHGTLQRALLLVACFACYGNTIGNDYAYDDAVVITENKFTGRGVAGIPDIFTHNTFAGSYEDVPLLERYRPLSLASFAVERSLVGLNPHLSHFINVLLFALTTWLLLAFLRRLFVRREDGEVLVDMPFIATLLFAVHPVHTEIVANIKGRDEILVLASALSTMLFVLRYLDERRYRHVVLAFVCFALALFSKENAITFLAVAPLTIFYLRKRKATDYLVPLLPLAFASALFLVVRGLVLTGAAGTHADAVLTDPLAMASRSQRYATIVYSLGLYLRLLFFPHPLTIDYHPFHIRLMDWSSVAVWLSLLVYVALVAYAVRGLAKRSVVGYGILFYLATLSVVSNLPFSTGTFVSERFVFLPSVGFAIVLAWLLSHPRLLGALPSPRYATAIVATLTLMCVVMTVSRNAAWKNDFTLLTTDARTSRNSVKANMAAAVAYLTEAAKPDRESLTREYRAGALEHAKQALSVYERNIEPARRNRGTYDSLLMLLGNTYGGNGFLPEALACYRTILRTGGHGDALEEMIQTTINRSDDVRFRLESTREFVDLVPDSFTFNYHLGLLYGKDKHDIPMAIVYFEKAVALAPDNVDALRGLGHAYYLANDFERAAACFQRIADRVPADPSLLQTLADLYRRSGNTAKQEEVLRRLQASGE